MIAPGSWWALYAGISLTLWVEYFRYTRQRARVVLAEPSVEASRLPGFETVHIVKRHLLPELGRGLLTIAAFGAATAVTAMAALGFVSVGIRPPTAEWGVMMTELGFFEKDHAFETRHADGTKHIAKFYKLYNK